MKATIGVSLVMLTMALGTSCHAGDRGAHREAAIEKLRAKFQAADTDRDGFLSRDEAAKGMPRIAVHFDEADADHDGKLSQAEVGACAARLRTQRQ